MRLIGRATLTTALLLATTGVAVAQTVEITPSVGYRWGGSIFIVDPQGDLDVEFDNAMSWGTMVDVALHDNIQVEFRYSRQDTNLTRVGNLGATTDLGPLAIDSYQGGVVFVLLEPEERIRPFFAITAGATSYSPEDADRVTKPSVGFGLGMKTYFTDHIGLRAELRTNTTKIDLQGTGLQCGVATCIFGGSQVSTQIDLHVGVVIGL
jgi:hypothetical protein